MAISNQRIITKNSFDPLPLFEIPDDLLLTCPEHGEFCPNAYWTDTEIENMLVENGRIDCPLCMDEISGGT